MANFKQIPADGLAGLKENFKLDAIAGFLVFLLAMPLSLGIAKASEFPPVMGLVTAIIGGLVVSFFSGSRLTIKGPAAGLIVIVAGAVQEFGHGNNELGWQLALGTIVAAGVLQVIFGVFKLGSLSDIFPASAVHGMLAAIGIIIISKQIHTMLGVDPNTLKGMEPLELLLHIPYSFLHLNPYLASIGVISLVILFGMPKIKNDFIRRIPSPLVVLAVAIPLGLYFDLKNEGPTYSLVKIGNFIENLAINVKFDGALEIVAFFKYLIMFALVGTVESLLTVKAIDSLDAYKRKSNYNKDLIAVGIGNIFVGILGGLPMISEVARSSANVNNGAQTRWANFFHGLFLLIAVLTIAPIIELIPNAALAAMLIAVGYRLASPNEFIKTYKIGKEQLIIFASTVVFTLLTDLLIGVGVGILAKIIIEVYLYYIKPSGSMFANKAEYKVENGNQHVLKINNSANFINFLAYNKMIAKVPRNEVLTIDFTHTKLIDHSFMEQLHVLEEDFHLNGGKLNYIAIDTLKKSSAHPLALRRALAYNEQLVIKEIKLSKRQLALTDLGKELKLDLEFDPKFTLLRMTFLPFNITRKALDAKNLLVGTKDNCYYMFTDIYVQESNFLTKPEFKTTVLIVQVFDSQIPDFSIEAEGLFYNLKGIGGNKDIDFNEYPVFSKMYFLTGSDEKAIRTLFTAEIIQLFESKKGYVIECKNNSFIFYRTAEIQSVETMKETLNFAQDILKSIHNNT